MLSRRSLCFGEWIFSENILGKSLFHCNNGGYCSQRSRSGPAAVPGTLCSSRSQRTGQVAAALLPEAGGEFDCMRFAVFPSIFQPRSRRTVVFVGSFSLRAHRSVLLVVTGSRVPVLQPVSPHLVLNSPWGSLCVVIRPHDLFLDGCFQTR